MDPIQLTTREAVFAVAVINAAIGFVLGLVPLGFGYFKGRVKLGIAGIIASTVGGAILGVFLSVPAMALFTWLVVRDAAARVTTEPTEPPSEES